MAALPDILQGEEQQVAPQISPFHRMIDHLLHQTGRRRPLLTKTA